MTKCLASYCRLTQFIHPSCCIPTSLLLQESRCRIIKYKRLAVSVFKKINLCRWNLDSHTSFFRSCTNKCKRSQLICWISHFIKQIQKAWISSINWVNFCIQSFTDSISFFRSCAALSSPSQQSRCFLINKINLYIQTLVLQHLLLGSCALPHQQIQKA